MFVIAVIVDTVKTLPEYFNRDTTEVITEQIEEKFSNKVLVDVGLCICLYDFVDVGDPYIYPAEGAAHQRVKFRLVVFRPFVGEIIVGKLISCNKDGLRVSLEFFEDIYIPLYLLQGSSEYSEQKGVWLWHYDEESEGKFVYEIGEEVRFRVRTINFTKVTTTAKGTQATTTTETKGPNAQPSLLNSLHKPAIGGINDLTTEDPAVRRRSSSIGIQNDEELPAVMQIIGSMNEDGLGLTSWWT
eukprot:gene3228-6382_t